MMHQSLSGQGATGQSLSVQGGEGQVVMGQRVVGPVGVKLRGID